MSEKLKSLNFPLIALGLFAIKNLIITPTIPDSIIMLGLGALYGYTQYLKRFQPYKLDDAVMRDLQEVKSALAKLNLVRSQEKLAEKKYF